jgi:hypothetical protein
MCARRRSPHSQLPETTGLLLRCAQVHIMA